MSVDVSNLAIMSSGIGNNNNNHNNNNHHLQRMIIAKPTQHHYLLLVRLPAPALIQQRCCSFRQGKPLRQLLITALRRLPEEKEMVEQFSQLFGDPGNRMKSPYAIERERDRMSHQIALKRASDVVWPCCCYLETLELVSQCQQECDLNAQTI
jgi:hypothetical protein